MPFTKSTKQTDQLPNDFTASISVETAAATEKVESDSAISPAYFLLDDDDLLHGSLPWTPISDEILEGLLIESSQHTLGNKTCFCLCITNSLVVSFIRRG